MAPGECRAQQQSPHGHMALLGSLGEDMEPPGVQGQSGQKPRGRKGSERIVRLVLCVIFLTERRLVKLII